jgi:HlyD family secretion protein
MRTFRPLRERLLAASALAAGLLVLGGCGDGVATPDAYGNFEADPVRVAAEVGGRLISFAVEEGVALAEGAEVGAIDPTPIELELAQVDASRRASASRQAAVEAQLRVLEAQLRLATSERQRLEQLAQEAAATPQQIDRADAEIAVLRARLAEGKSQLTTIADEVAAIVAQRTRLEDRLARARIVNPIAGTVLTKFVEEHELVAVGQPLYEIADLDEIELRAYVSGGQLPALKLGQRVVVAVDAVDGGIERREGRVRWIAATAEFTPSTLQTKEERVELVYAFRVVVPNGDGRLKIGMPAEVFFGEGE